jgi:hypothetical protein
MLKLIFFKHFYLIGILLIIISSSLDGQTPQYPPGQKKIIYSKLPPAPQARPLPAAPDASSRENPGTKYPEGKHKVFQKIPAAPASAAPPGQALTRVQSGKNVSSKYAEGKDKVFQKLPASPRGQPENQQRIKSSGAGSNDKYPEGKDKVFGKLPNNVVIKKTEPKPQIIYSKLPAAKKPPHKK